MGGTGSRKGENGNQRTKQQGKGRTSPINEEYTQKSHNGTKQHGKGRASPINEKYTQKKPQWNSINPQPQNPQTPRWERRLENKDQSHQAEPGRGADEAREMWKIPPD